MSGRPSDNRAGTAADARAVVLADELGSQLARMGALGPRVVDLLAMVEFRAAPAAQRDAMPLGGLQRVIEDELGARLRDLIVDIEERPLAPRGAARSDLHEGFASGRTAHAHGG